MPDHRAPRTGVVLLVPSLRYRVAGGALLLGSVILLPRCSAPRLVLAERGPQAYYQTGWPVHDTSREIERAFASVKQVSYTAEYVTYLFSESAGVTEADVLAGLYQPRADSSYRETHSKAGTATIIARSGNRITLLTTHHVVHFPAQSIQFRDDGAGVAAPPGSSRRVASVSVRVGERGILLPHPGRRPFEVLARDERNDLALLGVELGATSDTARFAALELEKGDARRLSWASFVYVLGFPRGYPMVTRGIVSNPDWDGRGAFVTDGLWNEGISGGLILAVRGETGALELVGLARAGAAERELRLQPDTSGFRAGSGTQRYEGALWIEPFLRIQYGITLSVSMTLVTEFISRHSAALRARGYL